MWQAYNICLQEIDMRNLVCAFIVCICCVPLFIQAQQLQPTPNGPIAFPKASFARHNAGSLQKVTAATCGMDTLFYPNAKATSLKGLLVNNATSAEKAGQYYDAPQPVTIYGFRFYAWKIDGKGGISTNAVCQVYHANPVDSLPMGPALVTLNVPVDTTYGNGMLSVLEKTVNFPAPITVSGPYVLVVGNPTPNSIGIVLNDYQSHDGLHEWLGMADLGGTWNHGWQVSFGPDIFDCDVLIDPVVTYDLAANFHHFPSCVAAPGNVNFVNTSSPIFMNRMYNAAVFLGIGGLGVVWDFGDGNTQQQVVQMDTVHAYTAAGNYIATLVDTLYQWGGLVCTADTFIALSGPPLANFNAAIVSNTVDFTDLTGSPNGNYLWDFGDGNTSTAQNPSHTYASTGAFSVCLTVTDACGTGSTCDPITFTAVGIQDGHPEIGFALYPNPIEASRGQQHVSIEVHLTQSEPARLQVFNTVGMRLLDLDLGFVENTRVELPIGHLPAGQYMVTLSTGTKWGTRRLQVLR